MWDYTDKVKDHFLHPRNARVIEDANAVGDVGSIICGDALRLMLKINPTTDIIEDAAFQTYGCGSAIASSSALTEMIKGKSLAEAEKITNQEIADYLGGLPPEKMHCSVMGREALDAAIANYHGQSYENSHDDGEIVCHCFGVGINKIKKVVWENHLTTVEEVTNYTKAGGGCQSCHMRIEEIIDEVWVDLERCGVPRPGFAPTPIAGIKIATTTERSGQEASGAATMDSATEHSKYYVPVSAVIKELNAGFSDGSQIELTQIADKTIQLKFSGNIAAGMMHDMTLNFFTTKLGEALGEEVKDLTIKA
ncbi:MAG TPA: Fe-S cluster assembly protein NifU [Candidatus Anaerobiospirillum stercoravium]|nr:Fe-S cluster assembly protein NifU [Candidatus Anaerobiospirillum stercoravium]